MANTLFDLAQQYLQQGLPDITGIFPPPVATTQPVAPMLPVMPISQQPAGIETLFPMKKDLLEMISWRNRRPGLVI